MPSSAPEVVERRHVRVAQARERLRLLAEAATSPVVPQEPRRQHLQRHVPVELLVPRAEHLAHPARAERLDDPIGGQRSADHRHLL